MRKINWLGALLIVILAGALGGCACQRIEPGYTGVLTNLQGDERGGIKEVGNGRQWYSPISENLYIFPNFVQRVVWTKDAAEGSPTDEGMRVLSQDQLQFVVDIGFSYFVAPLPGCSATVFRTYRKSIEDITSGPVRDIVRKQIQDVFSQYPASDIYGEKRPIVVAAIDAAIQERLSRIKSDDGNVCFTVEDFAITGLYAPQTVQEAVERKVTAAQEAQRERENMMRVYYQSQQDSIRAAMDARNNLILARSITPELLEYERLQLMKTKWDGKLPSVVSGGNSSLLFGIDK